MTFPRFAFSKNQQSEDTPATFATSATRDARKGNISRKSAGNVAPVAICSGAERGSLIPLHSATDATKPGGKPILRENVANVAIVVGNLPQFSFSDRPAPSNVADVAIVAAPLPKTEKSADLTDLFFEFEDRAAIVADGCGISQAEATEQAAKLYGFKSARDFYDALNRSTKGSA